MRPGDTPAHRQRLVPRSTESHSRTGTRSKLRGWETGVSRNEALGENGATVLRSVHRSSRGHLDPTRAKTDESGDTQKETAETTAGGVIRMKVPVCEKCKLSEKIHLAGKADYFDTKTKKWLPCPTFIKKVENKGIIYLTSTRNERS